MTDKHIKSDFEEEKQVVYISPTEDIDENEIKFWDLFLPLFKYKLQLILFVVLGITFGFYLNLIRQKDKSIPTSNVTNQIEFFYEQIKSKERQENHTLKKIINLVDNIEGNRKVLEVVSLEYRYETIDQLEKIKIIEFSDISWLDLNTKPFINFESNSFITVRHSTTLILKNKLKKAFTDYSELKKEMFELENIRLEKTLDNPSNLNKTDNNIDIKIAELERGINELAGLISYLMFSLSEGLFIELEQAKLPLSLWSDLSFQYNASKLVGGIRRIKDINRRPGYQRIKNIRFNFNEYINIVKQQIDLSHFTLCLEKVRDFGEAINALEAYESGKTLILKKKLRESNVLKTNLKHLIIYGLIGAMFGVLTIYARVFWVNAAKSPFNNKKIDEIIDALKYWKI